MIRLRRFAAFLAFLLAVSPPDCQAIFGNLLQCPEGTACVSSWSEAKQECVTRCEGPALQ